MSSKNKRDDSIKQYLQKTPYIRVIKISKTPDWDEFSKNALLVTATVIASGIVGYTIFYLMNLLPM